MIRWISSTAIGSTPANGSSSRMKRGRVASARAISTRRRSPPDSDSAVLVRRCAICRSPSNSSSRRLISVLTQRPFVLIDLQLEHRAHVLLDRQLAEDRRFLRQVRQAHARAAVDRQVCDRLCRRARSWPPSAAPSRRSCRSRWSCPRRWARAGRPPRRSRRQRDVLHDCAAAVALLQALDHQRVALKDGRLCELSSTRSASMNLRSLVATRVGQILGRRQVRLGPWLRRLGGASARGAIVPARAHPDCSGPQTACHRLRNISALR